MYEKVQAYDTQNSYGSHILFKHHLPEKANLTSPTLLTPEKLFDRSSTRLGSKMSKSRMKASNDLPKFDLKFIEMKKAVGTRSNTSLMSKRRKMEVKG